ncbi:putative WD repeat-containing protein 73-like [Apostichopus japonicus]|uniref:Putative WD repeat-containing protein 73-like n=1 Tax=Stichopus japonicus TaxID=307972 RepID=A0A2G8L686_STIJA|nr:putative WD repeat-containing protein 73-like [Apostichopus japonicus]
MYELSQPTKVLEWAKPEGVFVADSTSVNNRYEVLILSLPPKLVSSHTDYSKLTKDRDFKMLSGGFHNQPVHSMAMVSKQHFVTLSPSDTCDMLLWEIQEEKDFIVTKDSFKGQRSETYDATHETCCSSIAGNPHEKFQVARGSVFQNLEVVDLESGKALWSNKVKDNSSHPIGSIDFTDKSSILVCDATNGLLSMFDTRYSSDKENTTHTSSSVKSQSVISHPEEDSQKSEAEDESRPNMGTISGPSWTCSINIPSRHNRETTVTEDGGNKLAAVLSLKGEVIVYDLRNVNKPLCSATVTNKRKAFSPCIRWSPTQKNLLSVSGWDDCIRIYDITTFKSQPSQSELAEPMFIHDGHTTSQEEASWVVNHIWHEEEPNLLLSAGSDGSLHAWEWLPT